MSDENIIQSCIHNAQNTGNESSGNGKINYKQKSNPGIPNYYLKSYGEI